MYFSSPIWEVGINPGSDAITSGILFTIVAQVSSTVAGLSTTNVVVGSPSTVHVFLSQSVGAYTLPMHSLSEDVSNTEHPLLYAINQEKYEF